MENNRATLSAVGKYRTVAGFAPSFLSDTFTEQTNCFGAVLSPESAAALAFGQGVEMAAVYNS